MKQIIKFFLNRIPRPYLIKLSYFISWFTALYYKGKTHKCPVCEGAFRRFMPYGYEHVRENVMCPKCLSLERHRVMWLFLQNKTNFFTDTLKVLHIAPEQCFLDKFRKLKNLDYATADLESPLADIKLDVQNMPLDNDVYDVVICNHVLEHVDNFEKAVSEIHRVLKPEGYAILQVPADFSREDTYEDPTITDPKERQKHFLQYDHVRLFGRDYPERIKKAGFITKEENYTDTFDSNTKNYYRLPGQEFMYAFYKG